MNNTYEADLIFNNKVIHSMEGELSELPKKNSYIDIANQKYFVYDFTILPTKVLYLIKVIK